MPVDLSKLAQQNYLVISTNNAIVLEIKSLLHKKQSLYWSCEFYMCDTILPDQWALFENLREMSIPKKSYKPK